MSADLAATLAETLFTPLMADGFWGRELARCCAMPSRPSRNTASNRRPRQCSTTPANRLLSQGRVVEAIATPERAEGIATSAADPVVELWSLYLLAEAHHANRSYDLAVEFTRRSMALSDARRAGYSYTRAWTRRRRPAR